MRGDMNHFSSIALSERALGHPSPHQPRATLRQGGLWLEPADPIACARRPDCVEGSLFCDSR